MRALLHYYVCERCPLVGSSLEVRRAAAGDDGRPLLSPPRCSCGSCRAELAAQCNRCGRRMDYVRTEDVSWHGLFGLSVIFAPAVACAIVWGWRGLVLGVPLAVAVAVARHREAHVAAVAARAKILHELGLEPRAAK